MRPLDIVGWESLVDDDVGKSWDNFVSEVSKTEAFSSNRFSSMCMSAVVAVFHFVSVLRLVDR